MNKIIALYLALLSFSALGREPVDYLLDFQAGNAFLDITIGIPEDARETAATLIIPRSAPGTYAITDYAAFIEKVSATTGEGDIVEAQRGEGSYFTIERGDQLLISIRYRVDVKRMERTLTEAYATSKLRDNYLGLLGYSVFGLVEGLEGRPVRLTIRATPDWPVFSTLAPRVDPPAGQANFVASSFAMLADAQYLLGKDLQVARVEDAPIPLFVALYSEALADIGEIGRRGLISLKGLAQYFGYIPMPHYTIVQEYLVPPTPQHTYGFTMEHMNSMTSASNARNAITKFEENPRLGSIVHHIGHSWLPLRSYGDGYRPFEWQVAPLIDTIWLNEGFTWYIAFYSVLENEEILEFFRRTIATAPDYIKRMDLKALSRLGSTQYGDDFRIGRNLFSRGALMAHDLDVEIQKQTGGTKSFRDVMLGLLQWTQEHQRSFAYEEIEAIMSSSTSVDLSAIWQKWQKPPGP